MTVTCENCGWDIAECRPGPTRPDWRPTLGLMLDFPDPDGCPEIRCFCGRRTVLVAGRLSDEARAAEVR